MSLTWIDAIFSRLAMLWPFVMVRAWEKGLKLRKGLVVRIAEPGIHFAFWWFEEILVESVVQQTRNLHAQSVTTTDGHGVTFSATINFEVEDVEAKLTKVHNFDESLGAVAMMHMAQRVRLWSWAELMANQKELENSLEKTLTTRTKRWGVTIVDVALTDLVQSRMYRLYGDPVPTGMH